MEGSLKKNKLESRIEAEKNEFSGETKFSDGIKRVIGESYLKKGNDGVQRDG